MSFSSSPRAAYMSRGEEIKLIISGLVMLVALGVIFSGFTGTTPEDEGDPKYLLPLPQVVDAEVALERFKKQLDTTQEDKVQAPTAPYSPDPQLLTQVEDFELEAMESEALYELIAQLHSMPDEDLDAAPETHGTFSYANLKTEQGRFQARGKFLTLRGRFVAPLSQWVLKKDLPNGDGLGWVWQGLFRVGRQGYWVSVTDNDFEPQVGNYGTPLKLTVAFCNGYAFETGSGAIRAIPHVVAKRMTKITNPPPEAFYPWEIAYMALGVISLALLFVVGYALYTRGERKKFDLWQRDRRQKRLQKAVERKAFDKGAGVAETPAEAAGDAPAESPPATPATAEASAAAVAAAGPTDAESEVASEAATGEAPTPATEPEAVPDPSPLKPAADTAETTPAAATANEAAPTDTVTESATNDAAPETDADADESTLETEAASNDATAEAAPETEAATTDPADPPGEDTAKT